jgi:hypothetical protein
MHRLARRLDQAAAEINVYLLMVAIGLVVLDCLVLIAKAMPPMPPALPH